MALSACCTRAASRARNAATPGPGAFLPGFSLLYLQIIHPGKGDFVQRFVFLKSS